MRAETPKDHVEQHSSGASVCRHCGGEVAEDGYSVGGLVMDDSEIGAAQSGETDETPQQYEADERMRDAAFADALSRRHGYADGGVVFNAQPDELGPDGMLNAKGMRRRIDESPRRMTEEEEEAMKRPGYNFETLAERSRHSDEWYAARRKRDARGGSGPVGSTR